MTNNSEQLTYNQIREIVSKAVYQRMYEKLASAGNAKQHTQKEFGAKSKTGGNFVQAKQVLNDPTRNNQELQRDVFSPTSKGEEDTQRSWVSKVKRGERPMTPQMATSILQQTQESKLGGDPLDEGLLDTIKGGVKGWKNQQTAANGSVIDNTRTRMHGAKQGANQENATALYNKIKELESKRNGLQQEYTKHVNSTGVYADKDDDGKRKPVTTDNSTSTSNPTPQQS